VEILLTRARVRSWHPDDVESLVRHANDRRVWRNLRDVFPHPYTRADAEDWLRRAAGAVPETSFAIAVGGEAVGGIGFKLFKDIHRRSAEIGYWLGAAHWGQGIATEAVVALTEHVFAHFPVCRLFAEVFEWNPASMRVLEKAGYTYEGGLRQHVTKDGQTIDEVVYAIVRP